VVTMARSRARSRSPRNCRWEDQGWNCICSSCAAALRTWKGGHFEREQRENQPKGTAEKIIICQLRRVDGPHGDGIYHNTCGYHPSVRCVPDFVDGRRQLQDKAQKLKDKLMSRKALREAECRQLQDKAQKLKDKIMSRKPLREAEKEAEKEGAFQATCTSTEEEDMD
jgi:hypothetical protein